MLKSSNTYIYSFSFHHCKLCWFFKRQLFLPIIFKRHSLRPVRKRSFTSLILLSQSPVDAKLAPAFPSPKSLHTERCLFRNKGGKILRHTLAAASPSTRQEELNMCFTKPNIYDAKLQADSSAECSFVLRKKKKKQKKKIGLHRHKLTLYLC